MQGRNCDTGGVPLRRWHIPAHAWRGSDRRRCARYGDAVRADRHPLARLSADQLADAAASPVRRACPGARRHGPCRVQRLADAPFGRRLLEADLLLLARGVVDDWGHARVVWTTRLVDAVAADLSVLVGRVPQAPPSAGIRAQRWTRSGCARASGGWR